MSFPKSQMNLKIQIASDLHLDTYGDNIPDDIIIPNAPVLALLGDVGCAGSNNYRRFLYQQAERFDHVIFLAGNHEYYNEQIKTKKDKNISSDEAISTTEIQPLMTIFEQQKWMRDVADGKSNLHFLEKDSVEINGVVILGTTLWSWIPEHMIERAELQRHDYVKSFISINNKYNVKEGAETVRVEHTNIQFLQCRQWIEDQIDHYNDKNKPILILTHFAPSMEGTCDPRFDGCEMNCCWATDLTDVMQRSNNIVAWACGHTHYNFDFIKAGTTTRLVSNQRGHPRKGEDGAVGHETQDYDNEGLILHIPEHSDLNQKYPK